MNKYIHSIQVYITKELFKVFKKTFFCIFQGFSRILSFFKVFNVPIWNSRFFKFLQVFQGSGHPVCGKAYGVIFNCPATRAVHVDLADGYDTYSFILVLIRFILIRGQASKIRPDRGSQLVLDDKEMEKMMQD